MSRSKLQVIEVDEARLEDAKNAIVLHDAEHFSAELELASANGVALTGHSLAHFMQD